MYNAKFNSQFISTEVRMQQKLKLCFDKGFATMQTSHSENGIGQRMLQ